MSNKELNVMAGATERSILANSNEFYEDEDHALRINPSAFASVYVGYSAGVFETPPTLTDNGDGTITLDSFQCLLFDNANKYGELQKYSIPGFTYSLVDDTTNYVVVNYNSGFPVVQIIQNVSLINESSVIPVYTIVRTGVILHTIPWDSLANGLSNKLNERFVKTRRFERESGLSLTCPLRVVTVSPGVVWYGGNAVSLEQCVSNVDSFRLYYHSAGVWTSNTATEVNITQYDDGNDLQPLTANRYAVNWIFRGVENQKHLYAVLGVGDYTLAQAQAAQVPALPDAITSHAILVGKIIIQQGAVSPFSVQSAFDTTFTGGAVQTASGVQENNFGDVQTAINSLLTSLFPVGSFYTQYPDADSNDEATAFPVSKRPAALFGGTWVEQWPTEQLFFRTGGTDGQARTNGKSEDQFQGWQLGATADNSGARNYWGLAGARGVTTAGSAQADQSVPVLWTSGQGVANMLKPVSNGTNGTPRTGNFTEPKNRLIKVWKRVA